MNATPNAIGGSSSKSVNDRYRGIHNSYVGRFDLNTSGNSDPGLSSMLTPFVKLYGKYFSPEDEPQHWDVNFDSLYKNYFKGASKPIYRLDYFYSKNKETMRSLIFLENVKYFIDRDPYIIDGTIGVDVTENSLKKLNPDGTKKQRKKRITKKEKEQNKMHIVRVTRLKEVIEDDEDE